MEVIDICKELEIIQQRTLNHTDYDMVESWKNVYPDEYIQSCLMLVKEYPKVFSATSFTNKVLLSHWHFYECLKQVSGNEIQTKNDEANNTKEVEKKVSDIEEWLNN